MDNHGSANNPCNQHANKITDCKAEGKELLSPGSCPQAVVGVKANHVSHSNQRARTNHTLRDCSRSDPTIRLLVVDGSHKQALVIHASFVIGVIARLVKRKSDRGGDIHPWLFERIFQNTPVLDPCIRRCLLLHDGNLAVTCIHRGHGKDLGKARQAIVHVGRVARPNASIQTAKCKPAKGKGSNSWNHAKGNGKRDSSPQWLPSGEKTTW